MPAIDFALSTLQALKDDLLADPSDTSQDAQLTRALLAATDRVESYLGRKLCYREELVFESQGLPTSRYLVIPAYPLRVVDTVEQLDSEGTAELYEATKYVADLTSGILFNRIGSWCDPGVTRWNDVTQPPFIGNSRPFWRVTYSAGYYGPNQTLIADRDLPYDIEQACLLYAKSNYLSRDTDFRLVREHLLEAANWFDNTALDKEVERLLKPYRTLRQSR